MKITGHSVVLFLMLIILSGRTFCQDIIYRADGTVMNIDVVSTDGGTIIYKLPGDDSGKLFYLGISVIDSLKYEGMGTVAFQKRDHPVSQIKRNYIGTDSYNLLFGNLNFSYERLSPSGSTGFSVELLVNLNADHFYGVWSYWDFIKNFYLYYDPFIFFTKVGYKYYPLNYTLNRTGALRPYVGASLLLGQFKKEERDEYYYYDPSFSKKFAAVISWNVGTKLYLADGFALRADLVMSVIPFIVFNSLEAGIEIGF
jgi:hypothetical protein